MNEETLKFLTSLASELHTTSEHVFEIYTRQAVVESITDTIVFSIIQIGTFYIIKNREKLFSFLDSPDWEGGLTLLALAIALFIFIYDLLFFYSLSDTVSGFISPEFYAMEHILNKVK
jgi:hypothetical protein